MMSKSLDVLIKPVGIDSLDRLENPGVECTPAILEEAAVGNLVGQRVLEGVLQLGEEPRLVEELRCLQPGEPLAKALLRLLGDRLQQRERHVLADDRCRLEQALVSGSESVDARGKDGLRRAGELPVLERPREPIGPTFSAKGACLHQRPHALLEEEGIALRTRSEEHTSELQSRLHLVCRLLLEKKKKTTPS